MVKTGSMQDKTIIEKTLPDHLLFIWQETVDIWNQGFLGINIGQIVISILIFGFFILLRGIFSKYVLARLHLLTGKTKTELDDNIVDALIPPIKFLPIILGFYFAATYASLDAAMGDIFYQLLRSLIAFTIFWGLHRSAIPLSKGFKRLEKILTPPMVQWIFKAIRVLVLFFGAAVILEIWGIKIGPILAGLGIFGAAVALGAQDMFKNLIGGFTVIAEKRFNPGDWIKIDNVVEGVVEDIGIRSTQIRRFDKAPVHVPNALLADQVITNFSRMTHRRIYWLIGVEYRTTIDQLRVVRDEIEKYLLDHKDDFAGPDNVPLFVRIESFGASSIDIMVYCFTHTTVWGEWLEIKERFALAIKDIVENKAGTGFAFPSQSVYIEKLPEGDKPEVYVPPSEKQ